MSSNGFVSRIRGALALITVEPVQFFYCLMYTSCNVVRDNLFIEKVCSLDLDYPEGVCYNLTHVGSVENDTLKENVQRRVATLEVWDGVIMAVPSIFFCLFIGTWSDYHGRKPLLVLPFVGNILGFAMYMLNFYFFEELGTDHLLWSSALTGIFGATQCVNMGLYGYVADATTAENRTSRLSILNGVYSLAYVVGTTLGSRLFK